LAVADAYEWPSNSQYQSGGYLIVTPFASKEEVSLFIAGEYALNGLTRDAYSTVIDTSH